MYAQEASPHAHVNKLIGSSQRFKPLNICYLVTRNILVAFDQIKSLVPKWKIFYLNHNSQNALSFNLQTLNFKQITLPFQGYLQLLHHSIFTTALFQQIVIKCGMKFCTYSSCNTFVTKHLKSFLQCLHVQTQWTCMSTTIEYLILKKPVQILM